MTVQDTPSHQPASTPTGAKERVAEAASTTLSSASDATRNVVGEAAQQTKTVAVEARSQAQQMLMSTKTEVAKQAEERARQAADHLRGMSSSISALLDGRPDEATQIRGYLEQAQTKIEGVVNRIDTAGPQGVIDDITNFARRRPGVFLLAAGIAGFAVGRVARAGTTAAHGQQSPPQVPLQSPGGQFAPPAAPAQFGATAPLAEDPLGRAGGL